MVPIEPFLQPGGFFFYIVKKKMTNHTAYSGSHDMADKRKECADEISVN